MIYSDEDDENKVESSEIQEPNIPTTNMLHEDKFKQLKDDLLTNLRAELKNMLGVNTIDADIGNGTSYKKLTEILQEHLKFLKGISLRKIKLFEI